MNRRPVSDLALAAIGLLALAAGILACTSFSPDDKQVLYPAFDAPSGALGMALYDRETRHSDMLFLPAAYESGTNAEIAPSYIRGQWLADGRNLLFCWAGGKGTEDTTLDLALVPWTGRTSVRLFHLPGIKDAAAQLMYPLCVAGERAFFMAAPGQVARLDLQTGALAHHEFKVANDKFSLLPSPDGKGIFYLENDKVFGRLDPERFTREPLLTITNQLVSGTFFAYDRTGKVVAFVANQDGTNRLLVLRQGQLRFTRPLTAIADGTDFGNAIFSAKGERLWVTYAEPAGTNTASYGLMEIPLSEAPIRKTTLIAAAPTDKESNAGYFQFGMSHDGKTAAVASTYLACANQPMKPEDCALFFVDLQDPNRKVTRIALPVPHPPAPKQ